MGTIKDDLLKRIKNSRKEEFDYYFESSREESEINVMHGNIASASLNNCFYTYTHGEKSLFGGI